MAEVKEITGGVKIRRQGILEYTLEGTGVHIQINQITDRVSRLKDILHRSKSIVNITSISVDEEKVFLISIWYISKSLKIDNAHLTLNYALEACLVNLSLL